MVCHPVFSAYWISDNELRPGLIDELDYQLLPEEAWNILEKNYGMLDNQTPLRRRVIEQGMFVKHTKVEVYLLELKLCLYSKLEHLVAEKFSRAQTIGKVVLLLLTDANSSTIAYF